jgi:hypothetical protein
MAPIANRPDFSNRSFSRSSCSNIANSAVPDAVPSATPTSSLFSDLSTAAFSFSFSAPATASAVNTSRLRQQNSSNMFMINNSWNIAVSAATVSATSFSDSG